MQNMFYTKRLEEKTTENLFKIKNKIFKKFASLFVHK